MALGKYERRVAIATGLIIGVTVSSMLVKHALNVKDEQASQRPGNYDSLHSAVGQVKFPPLPQSIRKAIPNGIVVFFEGNRTSLLAQEYKHVNSWVIETTGSFRSERLFILAEVVQDSSKKTRFFRASEILLRVQEGQDNSIEDLIDNEQYCVIGQNSSSREIIVQIRKFSPANISEAMEYLLTLPFVESTRLSHWIPPF